jgi:hypothetical protein
MLTENYHFTFYSKEKPFVDYFNRLRSIGMSDDEIEAKLPQLHRYYYEMVIEGVFYVDIPTLSQLFQNWKTPF